MTVSKETPNKTSVFGCYVLSAKVTEKLPSQHCGLSWLSITVETQFQVFFSRNLSIARSSLEWQFVVSSKKLMTSGDSSLRSLKQDPTQKFYQKKNINFLSRFSNFFAAQIFHIMGRLLIIIVGQGVPEISVRTNKHTNYSSNTRLDGTFGM